MFELYENYNQRRIVGQLSTMVEINHGQKEHNLCSGWLSIQDLKNLCVMLDILKTCKILLSYNVGGLYILIAHTAGFICMYQ